MTVGILGILKAGGAYLPLDPNYPPERLALMIGDSGIPIPLTQARVREAGNWKLDADGEEWQGRLARLTQTGPRSRANPHPIFLIPNS